MTNGRQIQTYPFICRPKTGTVVYPYRQLKGGSSHLIARAFFLRLKEWLPEDIEVLDDVYLNCLDAEAPFKLEIALLKKDDPTFRMDIEIDVPYNKGMQAVHCLEGGDRYRDAWVSRHGWTVVRLAGKQVLDNPRGCADFLMNLDDVSQMIAVQPWTKNEALKIALKDLEQVGKLCYPEERLDPLSPQEMSDDERAALSLVEALPRTAEMQEKMATFKDAGHYERDQYIDFEPQEHIYTYDGRVRLLPVSSLIAYFFEGFNALKTAQIQYERYKTPIEELLDKWEQIGYMASEVGTFMHAQTENYFRDGTFETICHLCFKGEQTDVNIEKEREHFMHFIEDYKIEPYRQEWPVYDTELNIAGTIDMICREDDGTFTIYDWKRSTKVVNPSGQPIVDAFGDKTSFNGINLPDTSYYHYCIQQNLYRYMLEAHYGLKVKAMNLVVLHPDYPTYYVVEVPKMDKVIQQIVDICREKHLGHRLLR